MLTRLLPSTLRRRLFLLVALAVGPVVAAATWITWREWNTAVDRGQEMAERIARRLAGDHRDREAELREMLLGLTLSRASDPIPVTCASLEGIDQERLDLVHLGVAGPDGTVRCAVPALPDDAEESHAAIFLVIADALESGSFVGREVTAGPGSFEIQVVMAYPVPGGGAASTFVLFAEAAVGWIHEEVRRAGAPEGAAVFVVDGTGRILDLDPEDSAARGKEVERYLGARAAGFIFGSSGLHRGQGQEGIRVEVAIPRRVAFDQFLDFVGWVVLLFAASAGALAFVTWGTKVMVLDPVGRLELVTRQVAGGDLSARSSLPAGGAELGRLGAAFDSMAEALEHREKELKHLTRRLFEVREDERVAIARELHDQLGQSLLALKLDAAWMRTHMDPGPAQEATVQLEAGIERAMDLVGRLSSGLRPGVLDDLGLPAALEVQVAELRERTGINCTLEVGEGLELPPGPLRLAIFRIVQAALTNVARHSRSTDASVRLWVDGDQIVVEVADSGVGLGEDYRRGLGMVGMEERAASLGGRVIIDSVPAGGVLVRAVMPTQGMEKAT